MFILEHNFRSRNARKSIKGSKDLDSSLVSNENFSETLWPSGWALGQATWAKMTQNYFTYDVSQPPNQQFFWVQSTRLADLFEPLNSSSAIGREARALVRQPKTAFFQPKSKYEYIVDQFSKCSANVIESSKLLPHHCFQKHFI